MVSFEQLGPEVIKYGDLYAYQVISWWEITVFLRN